MKKTKGRLRHGAVLSNSDRPLPARLHATMSPLTACFTCPLLFLTCLMIARGEEKPIYQQLLESLKTCDSVLPPVPDTHPVNTLYNAEAVVPSQCYTRTEARSNPCYVCHQDQIEGRENVMNDADLQEAYSFSETGMTNH